MIEKLLRTLHGNEGELYYIKDGRRFLLADCTPCIKIFSETERLHRLGPSAAFTKHYITIALCEDMELKREVNIEFMRTVTRFELSLSLLRRDGIYEAFHFSNMALVNAGDGEWTFEISEAYSLIRRLLAEF